MVIKDQMRVTLQGQDAREVIGGDTMPDISPENLPRTAYAVWDAMVTRARQAGVRERYEGIDGWLWEGNRSWIVADLWPAAAKLKSETARTSMSALDQAASHFGKYNNARLNWHLIESGNKWGKRSLWWVRDEFNTEVVPGAGNPRPREPVQLTRRERQLDPHEVGEDRPPAPVTVTHVPKRASVPDGKKVEKSPQLLKVMMEAGGRPLHYTQIGRRAGFDTGDSRIASQVATALAYLTRRPGTRVVRTEAGFYAIPQVRQPKREPAPAQEVPASPPQPKARPVSRPSAPAPAPAAPDRSGFTELPVPMAPDETGRTPTLIQRGEKVFLAYPVKDLENTNSFVEVEIPDTGTRPTYLQRRGELYVAYPVN